MARPPTGYVTSSGSYDVLTTGWLRRLGHATIALGVVTGCGPSENVPYAGGITLDSMGPTAISIQPRAAVLGAQSPGAPHVATLALGEAVTILNPPGGSGFVRIRADGGTVGWVATTDVALHARAAAVIRPAPIHRRPDSLSVTSDELRRADIVAVDEFRPPWVRVHTAGRDEPGWISATHLVWDEVDVATASLLVQARSLQDAASVPALLASMRSVDALGYSVFADDVREFAARVVRP